MLKPLDKKFATLATSARYERRDVSAALAILDSSLAKRVGKYVKVGFHRVVDEDDMKRINRYEGKGNYAGRTTAENIPCIQVFDFQDNQRWIIGVQDITYIIIYSS